MQGHSAAEWAVRGPPAARGPDWWKLFGNVAILRIVASGRAGVGYVAATIAQKRSLTNSSLHDVNSSAAPLSCDGSPQPFMCVDYVWVDVRR